MGITHIKNIWLNKTTNASKSTRNFLFINLLWHLPLYRFLFICNRFILNNNIYTINKPKITTSKLDLTNLILICCTINYNVCKIRFILKKNRIIILILSWMLSVRLLRRHRRSLHLHRQTKKILRRLMKQIHYWQYDKHDHWT